MPARGDGCSRFSVQSADLSLYIGPLAVPPACAKFVEFAHAPGTDLAHRRNLGECDELGKPGPVHACVVAVREHGEHQDDDYGLRGFIGVTAGEIEHDLACPVVYLPKELGRRHEPFAAESAKP